MSYILEIASRYTRPAGRPEQALPSHISTAHRHNNKKYIIMLYFWSFLYISLKTCCVLKKKWVQHFQIWRNENSAFGAIAKKQQKWVLQKHIMSCLCFAFLILFMPKLKKKIVEVDRTISSAPKKWDTQFIYDCAIP